MRDKIRQILRKHRTTQTPQTDIEEELAVMFTQWNKKTNKLLAWCSLVIALLTFLNIFSWVLIYKGMWYGVQNAERQCVGCAAPSKIEIAKQIYEELGIPWEEWKAK